MPTGAATPAVPNPIPFTEQHTQTFIRWLLRLAGLSRVLDRLPDGADAVLERMIELILLMVLFVVVRWVAAKVVDRTAESIARREERFDNGDRAARIRTLGSLTKSIVYYTLGFLFLITALSIIGLNVAGVLGTASVIGLAVGFGAQKLVKDMISGFFLLLEDQYAVGDYVTIGTVTGVVEELGMRITRIRDDDGKLYILANGDINQVCNQSRGPVAGVLEIGIAASADIQKARELLNEAFATAAKNEDLGLADPARVEGLVSGDAAKTVLRVRFRAGNTHRPGAVALRLREIAFAALREAEIPLA